MTSDFKVKLCKRVVKSLELIATDPSQSNVKLISSILLSLMLTYLLVFKFATMRVRKDWLVFLH